MMNRDEILHWLHTLDRNSQVGIDEGGLCLREVTPEDELGTAYLEIGGIPEGIENGGE